MTGIYVTVYVVGFVLTTVGFAAYVGADRRNGPEPEDVGAGMLLGFGWPVMGPLALAGWLLLTVSRRVARWWR